MSNGYSGTNGSAGAHPNGQGSNLETGLVSQLRSPPQNLAAESGVLGSIILDNNRAHEVFEILRPTDFYVDRYREVFEVILELYSEGKGFDPLLLASALDEKRSEPKQLNDDLIKDLVSEVPHAANARYYAEIVREKSIQRQLIEVATEILQQGYANSHTADELLEMAEKLIFRISEEKAVGQTVDLGTILEGTFERISVRAENRNPVTGLGSGYYELDDMTSGFQANQLIILAARPSMGKTAFALNLCEHVAMEGQAGVLFVSLEMGQNELAERMVSSYARIDHYKLKTGNGLDNREMQMITRSFAQLKRARIHIDDTPSRNIVQINANARRIKARHGLGMVVIDYIQLIDPEHGDARTSRQEQISKISRRLKAMARELQVPVVALSQLNRGVETREDRRPRMADLRESGAIEQDADLVLLLHRPEYYDANDQPGVGELIVAKNRNGSTGTVKLSWRKQIMRFENLATVRDEPNENHPAF